MSLQEIATGSFADDLRAAAAAVLRENHGSSRPVSILKRVLERSVWVDRGYEGGPCLEWQGPVSGSAAKGKTGREYPRMCLDGQTVAVHRVVYTCLHGYIPGKKHLDHLCRNRRCVIHCEMVTHKTNMKRRDKARA